MKNCLVIKRVHLMDKEIKNIYYSSFPKKERMPFILMIFVSFLPTTKFYKFTQDGKPIGFIYYGVGISQVFLLFIGVEQNHKNQGYGSKILELIQQKYPKKSIVTTIGNRNKDKQNVEIRDAFYSKNGFTNTTLSLHISGSNQEIWVANKKFSKLKFSIFLLLYSFFLIWPIIRKIKI